MQTFLFHLCTSSSPRDRRRNSPCPFLLCWGTLLPCASQVPFLLFTPLDVTSCFSFGGRTADLLEQSINPFPVPRAPSPPFGHKGQSTLYILFFFCHRSHPPPPPPSTFPEFSVVCELFLSPRLYRAPPPSLGVVSSEGDLSPFLSAFIPPVPHKWQLMYSYFGFWRKKSSIRWTPHSPLLCLGVDFRA